MTGHAKGVTGVLLAAGMGTRLGALTAERPKALVEVAGAPLVAYGIAFLGAAGVGKIAVVGGYRHADLAKAVRAIAPEATLLENPAFRDQNAVSLRVALAGLSGDLLVCDTDYIRSRRLAEIVAEPREEVTLYVSTAPPPDPDTMCVRFGAENEIVRLAKGLDVCEGHSTGMLFVPAARREALLAATEAAIRDKGAAAARLEDALMAAAGAGTYVYAHDVGVHDWAEVDTPAERDAAEAFVREHRDGLALP